MEVMAEFVYQADVPTVSFILNFAFRSQWQFLDEILHQNHEAEIHI